MTQTVDPKLMPGIIRHIQEISGHNDCEILNICAGYVKLTTTVPKKALNLYGSAHGGYLFSLCDIAAGMSTYAFGYTNVTLQGNINYVSAARESERIYIEAKNLHKGKTTGVQDVQIYKENGTLIASASFTMFILDEI